MSSRVTTPKIEQQPTPGGYDFVIINAGNTHFLPCNKLAITDSATTVLTENMFAATVVDGCDTSAIPENSQIYSALITAAALYTVKHAISQNLSDHDLREYFFDAIQTASFKADIIPDPNLGVTFAGIVLYYDSDGNQKQFAYGLGNTALAALNKDGSIDTLHLQDNFLNGRNTVTNIPAIGGLRYTRAESQHVTAKVSSVNLATKSIQIMTVGCGPAFYDPNPKTKSTARLPGKMQCKDLPEHGKFDPAVLIDLVSPKEVQKKLDLLQKEKQAFLDAKVVPLNEIISEGSNILAYQALAITRRRNVYAPHFSEDNPMPSVSDIEKIMAQHLEFEMKEQELQKKLLQLKQNPDLTRGDDVLHLSIDVSAAFLAIPKP